MYKNALKEDLIRVVEDLDGTVESTDTIAKLKTKIEESSTFESDADFVKTLIKNCIDERETATHIGIREAEDWFRPINLAKEWDIYISSRSGSSKPLSHLLRDNAVFRFGPEQQLAFQTLQQKPSGNPVLHIFKQGAKLELHTDTSKFGYGAILLQQSDDSKLHPVHYFSKKTTPQEERYSSYKLEVLAIIESLKGDCQMY
ncbi:transposon Tf2-9 polyprotein [Trichonephila clavipes]|nr:transposon Tf2-9 polyprotein [Trichonephila clavipes]